MKDKITVKHFKLKDPFQRDIMMALLANLYKKTMECDSCNKYLNFYGHDIKCEKHRKRDTVGYYHVGCKRCDAILLSYDNEDSFCSNEI